MFFHIANELGICIAFIDSYGVCVVIGGNGPNWSIYLLHTNHGRT